MNVAAVVVEQLEYGGYLRTLQMQAGPGRPLIIALADEFDEPHSGPFHFLDGLPIANILSRACGISSTSIHPRCTSRESASRQFREYPTGITTGLRSGARISESISRTCTCTN